MRIITNTLLAVALCTTILFSCRKPDAEFEKKQAYTPADRGTTSEKDVVLTSGSNAQTYFLGSDASGEFQALQRRFKKLSSSLTDNQLQNIIITPSQLNALSAAEAANLREVAYRGGSVVLVTPDQASARTLAGILGKTVDVPLPSADHPLAWMAVKRGKAYLSFKMNPGETDEMYVRENPDTEELTPITLNFTSTQETTENIYGKKADALVKWLQRPANPIMDENSGEGDSSLQELVAPEEITIELGLDLYMKTGPKSGWGTYHNAYLVYRIWKAHSFVNDRDYYLIKQEITAMNNDLGCGPNDEYKWYTCDKSWDLWKKAQGQPGMEYGLWPDVYGPYMHSIHIFNRLTSDTQNVVKVDAYDPENSTSGGVTTTESFSYSLGTNVGYTAAGPIANITGGLSWGSTVSSFSPDLAATANMESNGNLTWTYKGPRPGSHYHVFDYNSHDIVRNILKSTCTVHHAWVWSIPASDNGYVNLQGTFELADEWLTYFWGSLYTEEVYLPVKRKETWTYQISTPPQYKQEWSMRVEPYSSAIEDYLTSHLGANYYWTNGVFCTEKANHSASDTDDEISLFVKASKDLFDNNLDLMKQAGIAGQQAGDPITDGYKIIWRNLKSTEPGDDFEYEVKL